MKVSYWLTINNRGAGRLSKGRPNYKMNEISLRISLELPDSLFIKPMLEASIKIPESAVPVDIINAEVIENAKEAIEAATGLNVCIKVGETKDDEI